MNERENNKTNKNKSIFLWMHSRKLLNQYFLKNKNYQKLNIKFYLLKAFLSLCVSFIFQRHFLVNFYTRLPKKNNIKNFLINIYSLMFASLIKNQFGNSIFIIGDSSYPIYQSLLLSSSYFKKIDLWIIYQGTGSIEKKINIKYPNNVKKIFFPFAKDSTFENKLLRKAAKDNKIQFLNIDTSLKINLSCQNNNLAIFQGYDKKKKLYPFYIFKLIKSILEVVLIIEMNKFDSVSLYLHPRLNLIKYFNIFIFNKKVKFKVFNNKIENFYKYVISYSPTINSSFDLKLRSNENVLMELGVNFNRKDIKNKIRLFLKED